MVAAIKAKKSKVLDIIEEFKTACENRRNEVNQYACQVNAELNSEIGASRENQHWIVALNAAQTADEEPEAAKMPKIG